MPPSRGSSAFQVVGGPRAASRASTCSITTTSATRAFRSAPRSPPQAAAGRAQGGGRGEADFWPGLKPLLAVADVQSGYHHDSISHALATVEQIGRKSGTYMTMIRTDSQLVTNAPVVGKDRY